MKTKLAIYSFLIHLFILIPGFCSETFIIVNGALASFEAHRKFDEYVELLQSKDSVDHLIYEIESLRKNHSISKEEILSVITDIANGEYDQNEHFRFEAKGRAITLLPFYNDYSEDSIKTLLNIYFSFRDKDNFDPENDKNDARNDMRPYVVRGLKNFKNGDSYPALFQILENSNDDFLTLNTFRYFSENLRDNENIEALKANDFFIYNKFLSSKLDSTIIYADKILLEIREEHASDSKRKIVLNKLRDSKSRKVKIYISEQY